MERVLRLLRSNIPCLIWFAFCLGLYILLFHRAWNVFAVVLIFHLASLVVAFSPVGEWFMRKREGVRRVEMLSEVEYLSPLFEEVYEEASELYPHLSESVELFITDEATVNAFAFGGRTVVLTRGAIEMMDEEQIKGTIAHEFGHLANGDTRMLLALVVGNGFFSVFYLFGNLIVKGLDYFIKYNEKFLYVKIPLQIVRFLFMKLVALFQLLSHSLIAIGQRGNEYRADEFACEIGYREQIISTLKLLYEMNIFQKMSLTDRMKSSHPHTASRIARLEQSS